MTTTAIAQVSGDDGGTGHLEELRSDPIGLMQRVRDECGDVGEFRLADNDVVLLTGADANEVFFRASDEELDQAAAYPFMTPIFGEGVVFDASPEERRRALHNQSLRDKFMRGHAETITAEIERMVADWDDEGEIDLLDWSAELFIYTSSSCLIGKRFREELDATLPTCSTTSNAAPTPSRSSTPTPTSRASAVATRPAPSSSSASRRSWSAERRGPRTRRGPGPGRRADVHHRQRRRPQFGADVVTGMFISMMFAGHHTTSTTASWTLIELLRNPDVDGPRRRRDGRARRARRRRGHLPGAARDPVARGVDQGGAAAAPAAHPAAAPGDGARRGRRASRSPPASSSARRQRCRTGSPRRSTIPTASTRRATSSPARTTSTTRGTGSRSARAATAASAPRSP